MTAEQIKAWLLLVHEAQMAVAHIQEYASRVPGVDTFDVNRTEQFLKEAYEAGLEAHGQAVLAEYLANRDKTTAA